MQAGHDYRLIMRAGPTPGASYELTGDLVTVGRYSGNTIIVPDEGVSRIHCRLRREADGYIIEDLGSANGVYINGTRITAPKLLKPGDAIKLGADIELVYEMAVGPALASRFAQRQTSSDKPVSDTGGTVLMRAIDPTSLDRTRRAPGAGTGSASRLPLIIGG